MPNVEHEDSLLNTRTGIFLAINTILIAAIGKEGFKVPFIVEILGLIISILWILVAHFNRSTIREAHGYSVSTRKYFNPTDILAIWIPSVFILFWVVVNILGIM